MGVLHISLLSLLQSRMELASLSVSLHSLAWCLLALFCSFFVVSHYMGGFMGIDWWDAYFCPDVHRVNLVCRCLVVSLQGMTDNV
jgi:hypothetical protein